MESYILIILGAVLFAHAFSMLKVTEAKTTGIIAAVGTVGLIASTVYRPLDLATDASVESLATVSLLGAIYTGALAAVGLWGYGTRALGIYSIVLAALMVVFGVSFFAVPTLGLGLVALVLAAVFALLFFYEGVPFKALRLATAWVFLIGSVVVAVAGAAFPLNLMETLGLL